MYTEWPALAGACPLQWLLVICQPDHFPVTLSISCVCVCVCVCVQSVFALQSAEQVDKISASLGAYDTLPDQSGTKQYTLESYSFEHFR